MMFSLIEEWFSSRFVNVKQVQWKVFNFCVLFLLSCYGFSSETDQKGWVDDFDGKSDPTFIGKYMTFGENNLGPDASRLTSSEAHSGENARLLEQTETGGQFWGVVTQKKFDSPVDVSQYETFSFVVKSLTNDANRSVGVEFLVEQRAFRLKAEYELSLADTFNKWTRVNIAIEENAFTPPMGKDDFAKVTALNFLIRNNNKGTKAASIVFDDLHFHGEFVNFVQPQNLKIKKKIKQYTLSWDPVEKATAYTVYRTRDFSVPTERDQLQTVNTTSFKIEKTKGDKLTHYWVVANFDEKKSGFSNSVTVGPSHFMHYAGPEKIDFIEHARLVSDNAMRATAFIEKLYNNKTGAQASYYAEPGTPSAESYIAKYGRVWAYDAGIALSQAIRENSPTTIQRARWLYEQAVYYEIDGEKVFAGWPFSINQAEMGSAWEDPRQVSGANMWTLYSVAEFISSAIFEGLSQEEKDSFYTFYNKAIVDTIQQHVSPTGPNANLITAGFSRRAMLRVDELGGDYYHVLDIVGSFIELKGSGAGKEEHEAFFTATGMPLKDSDLLPKKRFHAVTEHNIDFLEVLNYTLDHYDRLLKPVHDLQSKPEKIYTREQVNQYRINLRDTMFAKLYNFEKQRFITGRSEKGILSPYTAIDNTSWLVSALKLNELDQDKIDRLTSSLVYTVDNFVKYFNLDGKRYYGTHYFLDDFTDIYIAQNDQQDEIYHTEATCGLIVGLIDFIKAFPDHEKTPYFREVARRLWVDMQNYIADKGFIYASAMIKDLFHDMESAVAAIWFLYTLHEIKKDPDFYLLSDR